MYTIKRRKGERIAIGPEVYLQVLSTGKTFCTIGIDAPLSTKVFIESTLTQIAKGEKVFHEPQRKESRYSINRDFGGHRLKPPDDKKQPKITYKKKKTYERSKD